LNFALNPGQPRTVWSKIGSSKPRSLKTGSSKPSFSTGAAAVSPPTKLRAASGLSRPAVCPRTPMANSSAASCKSNLPGNITADRPRNAQIPAQPSSRRLDPRRVGMANSRAAGVHPGKLSHRKLSHPRAHPNTCQVQKITIRTKQTTSRLPVFSRLSLYWIHRHQKRRPRPPGIAGIGTAMAPPERVRARIECSINATASLAAPQLSPLFPGWFGVNSFGSVTCREPPRASR